MLQVIPQPFIFPDSQYFSVKQTPVFLAIEHRLLVFFVIECRLPMDIKCGDGHIRKFVVDLLFIAADHQEMQMHMGLSQSAKSSFPCCICLCPQTEMGACSLAAHRSHSSRTTLMYTDLLQEMITQVQNGRRHDLVQKAVGRAQASQLMVVNGWMGFRGVDEEEEGVYGLPAPDILHGLFEGIMLHFRAALKGWAAAQYRAVGVAGVMARLDIRLQNVAKITNSGWRIPTKDHRLWFSSNETFQAVEHAAVLQVLPFVLRGVFCDADGVDWGLRTSVAMAEWWLVTCRTPMHTEATLQQSDMWTKRLMKMLVDIWGPYQSSQWKFPKFHNLSHFTHFIR